MRGDIDRDGRGIARKPSLRNLATASLVLALAACGGGGQSTSPSVTMSVSPKSLSVSATTTQAAPTGSFTVDFADFAGEVFLQTVPSGKGISQVINHGGVLPAQITVQFLPPVSLAPGTYNGTVTVKGCLNQACTSFANNSPQTVTVQYTVTQSNFALTGLSPSTAYVDGQDFTLTVNGTAFTPQSGVLWNDTLLTTTFVSSSQLTAQVPASDLEAPGNVTIVVGDTVNGTTAPASFVVAASPLAIDSLSPATVYAGGRAFPLTVTGSSFTPQSEILWDNTSQTTTYVSPTQLTTDVPATYITASGKHKIMVEDPTYGLSNSQTLIVAVPHFALDTISPTSVTAGSPAFMLTVLGTAFTATSVIEWNGTALTTAFISSTELTAQIPVGDISTTGTASIMVTDPNTSPSTTGAQTLTIAAPSKDAVAYQINAAHNGAVTFANMSLPFPTSPAWSVDVGGTPSYALVADGKVFVTVLLSSGSELLALDQATGNTVWGPIALGDRATAAYDNGQVFVASGSSTPSLQAYDADSGALEWSTGFTGSAGLPTAADGALYLGSNGTMEEFSESDGTLLWTQNGGGTAITPAVTADGLYITYSCATSDVRPATGEVIWYDDNGCFFGGAGLAVAANQLVYGDSGTKDIFAAGTGDDDGSYTSSALSFPAFSASMGYFLQSGTLTGETLADSTVQWSFTGDGQLGGSPIVVNQYVFVGSATGNLYALDGSTGAQVWNVSLGTGIDTNTYVSDVPFSGMAAGDGLLVVPVGTKVTAYILSTNP